MELTIESNGDRRLLQDGHQDAGDEKYPGPNNCSNSTTQQQQQCRRDWSGVAGDVLRLVIHHLPIVDRIAVSRVCAPWRRVVLSVRPHDKLRYGLPCLLYMHSSTTGDSAAPTYRLVDPVHRDNKHASKGFPEGAARLLSSRDGWLLFMSWPVFPAEHQHQQPDKYHCDIYFVNPLSRTRIRLPTLSTEQICGCYSVSDRPTSPSCVVLALLDVLFDFVEIAFCRPGDAQWTIFERECNVRVFGCLTDPTWCAGSFWCLDRRGNLPFLHWYQSEVDLCRLPDVACSRASKSIFAGSSLERPLPTRSARSRPCALGLHFSCKSIAVRALSHDHPRPSIACSRQIFGRSPFLHRAPSPHDRCRGCLTVAPLRSDKIRTEPPDPAPAHDSVRPDPTVVRPSSLHLRDLPLHDLVDQIRLPGLQPAIAVARGLLCLYTCQIVRQARSHPCHLLLAELVRLPVPSCWRRPLAPTVCRHAAPPGEITLLASALPDAGLRSATPLICCFAARTAAGEPPRPSPPSLTARPSPQLGRPISASPSLAKQVRFVCFNLVGAVEKKVGRVIGFHFNR